MSQSEKSLKYFTKIKTDMFGVTAEIVYNLENAVTGELITSVSVMIPQPDAENQTVSDIRASVVENAPHLLSEILTLVQSGRAILDRAE